MKNNSNIYDIDGEIIRRFDDVHRFTALEATKICQKYLKKIEDLRAKEDLTEEEQKKLEIYTTYCKNLQYYIHVEMAGMSKEQLEEYYKEIIPEKPKETTAEDVEKALNDLKNDTETREDTKDEVSNGDTTDSENDADEKFRNDGALRREPCDVSEERTVSQDDLLVERDDVNTVMDSYVEYKDV